jgi:hypothetical protein
MTRELTCREFLEASRIEPGDAVEGTELERLFWTTKQREEELARRERYWASVNDALRRSYEELEALRRELERVNETLEKRVETQVGEILRHTAEVAALNVQLQESVKDRSRALQLALQRAGHEDEASVLTPGTLVGGRARIVRKIGEGGMGVVYEADDLLVPRRIALKVMRSADRRALRYFVAEAEAASSITSSGIVRVLHVDVSEDGHVYQLMELVRGVTLAKCKGRFSLPEIARVGAGVAEALAAAHAHGVIHRDIKPDNVILSLTPPGVRVLDFGVAKQVVDDAETAHVVVGTPLYMSPDQIRAPASVTPAADVYSLGVVLYELVAGRRPFVGGHTEAILYAHLHEAPVPLAAPEPVGPLVAACLDKDPAKRPAANDVRATLDAFADRAGADGREEIGRRMAAEATVGDVTL